MDDFDIVIDESGHKTCKMCRGAVRSEKLFTVTTHIGNTHKVPFNYCPVCGRELDEEDEDGFFIKFEESD